MRNLGGDPGPRIRPRAGRGPQSQSGSWAGSGKAERFPLLLCPWLGTWGGGRDREEFGGIQNLPLCKIQPVRAPSPAQSRFGPCFCLRNQLPPSLSAPFSPKTTFLPSAVSGDTRKRSWFRPEKGEGKGSPEQNLLPRAASAHSPRILLLNPAAYHCLSQPNIFAALPDWLKIPSKWLFTIFKLYFSLTL